MSRHNDHIIILPAFVMFEGEWGGAGGVNIHIWLLDMDENWG